ncbi:MAG: S-layer homology domain-containing protein, partial [Ruminiclostridium sp.]|nr:S-layer homology domain-containing protein [Ruminiclostridium sp.]
NGATLKTEEVAYGTTPSYTGEIPTKTATDQYTYTFNNTWSPAIVSVTGDATYTAQFDSSVNEYTVTYTDGVDGAEVFADQTSTVDYGTATPAFEGTPTRTAYTFVGWTPVVAETVTGNATYAAQWEVDIWDDENDKTTGGDGIVQVVTFTNEDGSYAASGTVDPDMTKVSATAKSGYKFNIWTKNDDTSSVNPDAAIENVTGGTTIQFFANWAKKSTSKPSTDTNIPDKVPLETQDHFAYIIGYPDGTVKPAGNITRAEVATIFFRLLTDEARDLFWSTTNEYSDVAANQWYNNAISTLSSAGIINGYEDGTFRPNAPITRAEFAKIAVSFFSYVEEDYQGIFSDVTADQWYALFVEAASELGLVTGYEDGTFRPTKNITRAEACTIVNRTIQRAPHEDQLHEDMAVWPDNPAPGEAGHAWYYEQVQEATNSHDYTFANDYEDWTEILENRDWAALEKAWADSNDAPGGEVMK